MKVIFATGGSGGHLFPAVDVAIRLKRENHQVSFLGPIKVARQMLDKNQLFFEYLNVSGFVSKGIVGKFQALWRMMLAVVKSIGILRREKPDVVCGFGSYASFAVVAAAKFLKIPTMIHEQNAVPGKANLYLARHVNKVAISFQETEKYFPNGRTVLTGCPSHVPLENVSRSQACQELKVDENKFIICVLGGSQGSHFLNEVCVETFKLIKENLDIFVIHVCGQKEYDLLEEQYKKLEIPVALFTFLEKIEYAYHAADLIISRAGALTLAELVLFQKKAIIIPYPHAGNHQVKNAQAVKEFVPTCILSQEQATPERLKEAIWELKENLFSGKNNFKNTVEPGQNLLKEIVSLIE